MSLKLFALLLQHFSPDAHFVVASISFYNQSYALSASTYSATGMSNAAIYVYSVEQTRYVSMISITLSNKELNQNSSG